VCVGGWGGVGGGGVGVWVVGGGVRTSEDLKKRPITGRREPHSSKPIFADEA